MYIPALHSAKTLFIQVFFLLLRILFDRRVGEGYLSNRIMCYRTRRKAKVENSYVNKCVKWESIDLLEKSQQITRIEIRNSVGRNTSNRFKRSEKNGNEFVSIRLMGERWKLQPHLMDLFLLTSLQPPFSSTSFACDELSVRGCLVDCELPSRLSDVRSRFAAMKTFARQSLLAVG